MRDKCRAKGCPDMPMPNGLCGVHDEMAEDGIPFELRRGRGRPRKEKPPKEPGKPGRPAKLYPKAERRPMCCVPTKKGTERCHNAAAKGSDMCGLHRRLVELGGAA